MPDCHQVAKDLSEAFNEYRLARTCNIQAYNESMRRPDIPGDTYDLLGNHGRTQQALTCLLKQCDVAINLLHNLGIPARALAEFYVLVRDGDPTPEAWQSVVGAWPAAYADARACNGQAHESAADGAATVQTAEPKTARKRGRNQSYSLKKDNTVWAAWKSGGYDTFAKFLAENPQSAPYDSAENMRKLQARVKQRNKNADCGD